MITCLRQLTLQNKVINVFTIKRTGRQTERSVFPIIVGARDKPGFVRGKASSSHLSNPALADGDERSTRESAGRVILTYSTLLLMGFARPRHY